MGLAHTMVERVQEEVMQTRQGLGGGDGPSPAVLFSLSSQDGLY